MSPDRRNALAIGLAMLLLPVGACGELAPRPNPSAQTFCETARQRVVSMPIFIRVDRFAAKRMTAQEFLDGSRGQLPIGAIDPQMRLCVLAFAGDIRQPSGPLDPGPRTWSVHVSVEATDQALAGQYSSDGVWPPYVDALPSR